MKPICEFCLRVRGYRSETKISRLVRENVPKWMGTATLEKQMKEGKDLSPRHLVGVGGGGWGTSGRAKSGFGLALLSPILSKRGEMTSPTYFKTIQC
jgi:hypothetical protein